MDDNSPADPASGPPSETARRGVSRGLGLGISAGTALIVFAVGAAVFPAAKPSAPAVVQVAPPPPPPPAPPPPPPAPTIGPDGGAASGGKADAEATAALAQAEPAAKEPKAEPKIATAEPEAVAAADSESETPSKRKKSRKDRDKDKDHEKDKDKESALAKAGSRGPDSGAAEGKAENATLPPSDGSAAPPADAPKDKEKEAGDTACALAEKDMAREAWRRNWPTVCPIPSTGKAFILIPIKGSIEGESHELRRKPKREARVTLPAGSESQLTMKQYKVKKLGFKELWVSNDESGARLRVKLQPGTGDPVFEIKDGYAKITVATPAKE